jgi:hypothetical protein
MVLLDEDWGEFARLETALVAELAPEGALQSVLARRVARAAWRLIRTDRLESEVFAVRSYAAASPGLALIRDGNGTRSIETLIRYRGAAMAELTRSLRTLKALQAEAAKPVEREATPVRAAAEPAPVLMFEPKRARAGAQSGGKGRSEACRKPSEPDKAQTPNEPGPGREPHGPGTQRYEPEPHRNPHAPEPGRSLHEATAPWNPNEPGPRRR